ncbi:MAG: hypothetical protein EDM03_01140 [Porphyrobacter sp. IPPAS B-1204]|nr:MAG: hypothetical protein EDM03_01140 [Porphyrobacter sp. IPPAS B-1204]
MRIGLISALRRTNDGTLRADLALAGRSVLAWQVALLQSLGVERVLCLTDGTAGVSLLPLQHSVEASGGAFHVLKGFTALPALIRAEDDLVILADGLVPSPEVLGALTGGEGTLQRMVAAIPADHALAVDHPEDFERIDAARHWAGVLVMRGAAVQHLADFPEDADAISVLLRLALQAGTPCSDLGLRELVPESWLLADSADAVALHQRSLIAAAAGAADWRAPMTAIAARLVRTLAPRGLEQGGVVAGGLALVLLLGGVMAAAFAPPAAGLILAGLGAFAARVSIDYSALAARLRREGNRGDSASVLAAAVDTLAALALWFALSPWPEWQPLAVLGPLAIGLARLAARGSDTTLGMLASDRASVMLALALPAAFGFLPEALACLALGLLAALLLRASAD